MKVLWLTNIPSPYRMKFFEELGKKCELTVLFEKKESSERDNSWKNFQINNFKAFFLEGKSVGVAEAFCPSVVKYLNNQYNHIVVTNYSDPTGMIAIIYMKIHQIRYEIEGDGAFPKKNSFLKRLIKKFFLSGAELYFSSAKLHDEYYIINGVPMEKIRRYPFTSVKKEEILNTPYGCEVKLELRKKLGMHEKYIVLAVGQFISRKGYDILIRAASKLNDDYGIYIVGGKAPENYLELVERLQCTNVKFIDFKQSEELNEYYKAADVFVHPTREDIWGLVVNEAMAKGLPVITTNKCIAGLELIQNKINGLIGESEDPEYLRSAIEYCCKNKGMSVETLKTANIYTIENMACKHMQIWNKE